MATKTVRDFIAALRLNGLVKTIDTYIEFGEDNKPIAACAIGIAGLNLGVTTEGEEVDEQVEFLEFEIELTKALFIKDDYGHFEPIEVYIPATDEQGVYSGGGEAAYFSINELNDETNLSFAEMADAIEAYATKHDRLNATFEIDVN